MPVIELPSQIREKQTSGFISLLNDIKNRIDEDRVNLKNVIIQLNGILERFYDPFATQLTTAIRLKKHILMLEKKKCDSIPTESRCNVHDIAEDTGMLCATIIAEVKAVGLSTRQKDNDNSVNVRTTVTQNQEQKQSQHQDVIVKILIEAAKDELTGKQWKELLAVAQAAKSSEEAHKGIMEKLKEYGANVSASIVANILTNLPVWNSLSSMISHM